MTTTEESDDAFAAHRRRDPLPGAGIRIILITDQDTGTAPAVIAPLVDYLTEHGRPVEERIVDFGEGVGFAGSLERGLEGATLPIVLVTTAREPWTIDHLEPLLKAIDEGDHVLGLRPQAARGKGTGWLGFLMQRFVFAVPLEDVHSPCRLHRLEKLAAIPLQSRSSFLDVEILAKATFLGHLIDQVDVPPLSGLSWFPGWLRDLGELLRKPRFERLSSPAEEAQCQGERTDRPGGQDEQGKADGLHAVPVEDDLPERTDQLRQGQDFDQGLEEIGKSVRHEEHAGQEPHGQHDQVHEAADRLGGRGSAAHQETNAGEGEPAQKIDEEHEGQIAADRHLEHQLSQQEENRQVGEDEGQPRAQ
jgi:hypothetical protein